MIRCWASHMTAMSSKVSAHWTQQPVPLSDLFFLLNRETSRSKSFHSIRGAVRSLTTKKRNRTNDEPPKKASVYTQPHVANKDLFARQRAALYICCSCREHSCRRASNARALEIPRTQPIQKTSDGVQTFQQSPNASYA